MLAALLPVLAPILSGVLDKLIPDPEARAKAIGDIFGQLQNADLAQMEVNKAEAQSSSIFVSGWRPAIGWICAAALFFEYLLSPLGQWVGFIVGYPIPKPPTLSDNLWELLMGILGLGALRSFEKIKGAIK